MRDNENTVAVRLTPPASTVVGRGHPYRLALHVPDEAAGEGVTVHLALRGEAHSAALEADGVLPPAPATARSSGSHRTPGEGACPTHHLSLNVDGLAPGEYRGELTVTCAGRTQTWPVAFFRVAERLGDTVPFGVYALPVPATEAECRALFEAMRATGLDEFCLHMHTTAGLETLLDAAARCGLRFRPSVGPLPRENTVAAAHPAVYADGTAAARGACLNSPAVRDAVAAHVTDALAACRQHPGFSGTVYFGDDLFLAVQFKEGRAILSCHCPHCRAEFKRLTGSEPPTSTAPRRGAVPPEHPWLRWLHYRCAESYGGLVCTVEAARDRVDPGIALGLCHGWPDNPFVSIATGLYSPLTQTRDLVSSYCYPFLRSPAADFICHREIGRMGRRERAAWMLGVFGADHVMVPPWHVTQNYWNMLAAGYTSIYFFSWWDYDIAMRSGKSADQARAQEALAALARCGQHKDWILPAARHWQTPAAANAVLYSFTTEAFDVAPQHQGNLHSKRVCEFLRLALRHQVPMQVLCEEEILADQLSGITCICLPDVRALRADVCEKLAEFISRGGTVMLPADPLYVDGWHPGSRLYIRGALELAPESMVAYLADHAPRPVTVTSPDVTVREFRAGACQYYVFVNNYPDRYWGMPYAYGEPESNHRYAAMVTSKPVEAVAQFAAPRRWLFDMSTGDAAGTTDAPLALALEPAWGRVFVALPVPEAILHVQAPAAVPQGGTCGIRIDFRDSSGGAVPGAFTVKLDIRLADGTASAYSGFYVVADGVAEIPVPVAGNDVPGPWQLQVEGGFPRRSRQLSVAVTPGARTALTLAPSVSG